MVVLRETCDMVEPSFGTPPFLNIFEQHPHTLHSSSGHACRSRAAVSIYQAALLLATCQGILWMAASKKQIRGRPMSLQSPAPKGPIRYSDSDFVTRLKLNCRAAFQYVTSYIIITLFICQVLLKVNIFQNCRSHQKNNYFHHGLGSSI